MLTYSDVEAFIKAGLTEAGISPMPLIDPGPFSIPGLQKKSPNAMVFATVGNGAGLTLEQLYDQVFITIRVLGRQNDYDSAEQLALALDKMFLAVNQPRMIGSTRVLYITRSGGAPQLVDYDASQRYSFQTTYITPAGTGL